MRRLRPWVASAAAAPADLEEEHHRDAVLALAQGEPQGRVAVMQVVHRDGLGGLVRPDAADAAPKGRVRRPALCKRRARDGHDLCRRRRRVTGWGRRAGGQTARPGHPACAGHGLYVVAPGHDEESDEPLDAVHDKVSAWSALGRPCRVGGREGGGPVRCGWLPRPCRPPWPYRALRCLRGAWPCRLGTCPASCIGPTRGCRGPRAGTTFPCQPHVVETAVRTLTMMGKPPTCLMSSWTGPLLTV